MKKHLLIVFIVTILTFLLVSCNNISNKINIDDNYKNTNENSANISNNNSEDINKNSNSVSNDDNSKTPSSNELKEDDTSELKEDDATDNTLSKITKRNCRLFFF